MVGNIFTPRKGTDKVPYVSPKSGPYDEYYEDAELIYVPVPIEGDEENYQLVPKIKTSRRSIAEVINSQADDVGLDNIMRKFALTGDTSILPSSVQATDEVLDLTKLPQDSAQYFEYIHHLAAEYSKLPIELRKDLTMEEFAKTITNEDIKSYYQSLIKKDINTDNTGGDNNG